jgi:hypothetical protein
MVKDKSQFLRTHFSGSIKYLKTLGIRPVMLNAGKYLHQRMAPCCQ